MLIQPIDYALLLWFILAALSTAYVAWDQFGRGNPEPTVMKWGFVLVTLYAGPLGLFVYVMADKEPRPGTHEAFIAPLWKQGIGSTIHCVAGDATGIILAAAITGLLGLPMGIDLVIEYVAGFAFGLFIFQSLFMKSMMGGSYRENLRRTFVPELISMNAMMAGMAPVMSFLMMGRDMRAMDPTELLFWGVMSLGVIVGFIVAYPFNIWMVEKGLKHGLMTLREPSGMHEKREPAAHPVRHAQEPDRKPAAHGVAAEAHHNPGIPSIAAIGRHPIHPMLVPLPIGFFLGAFVGDLLYWGTRDPMWATASAWLVGGGIAGGLVAAAAGLVDFVGSERIRALVHAWRHLIGNLILLCIAATNLALRVSVGTADAVLPWGLAMSGAVVALLAYTGWHGGEMVFGHGVGMRPHEHGAPDVSHAAGAHAASPHGGHDRQPAHASFGHGGHGRDTKHEHPAFAPTGAQIAAMIGTTALLLIAAMVMPGFHVNLSLGARDVGGVIMPPGMIMDFNTPAEAMRDMGAVHPRRVSFVASPAARGDQPLEPRLEGGVKVFDIEASVIRWYILGNVPVEAYAYNRQIPGPRIRVRQGDRIRVNLRNALPEPTTVHWHGLILPNEMDGPSNITQAPIPPGGTYVYEFTAGQSGTFFYHTHHDPDRQQGLGLYGALIIDPAAPEKEPQADLDHVMQMQEWLKREWLTYPAMQMEGALPNFFTINGKAYPETETIRMRVGQTIKIRFIGSHTMSIHPMHIHGGPFTVVAVDGETLAPNARYDADTVNVGPGQRFDVIWTARRPGKWLVHCHIPHHTKNNNVEVQGGGGLTAILLVEP